MRAPDACILQQRSASLSIQLRTRMIHPCSPWVATSARGKVCGRGACWRGGKRAHCRCSSWERNHCWRSTANSCKGWSPTRRAQRGPGRSSAGTASTPRFLDRLLASSSANQKSIRMGTSRSPFEARSISFASWVRSLSFRLCWGREGNNALGVRVCGGVANERKGRRGKRLQTKPEAQMERALSIDLKTFPPNAPVSLGSQCTAKHTCSSRYSDVC